LAFATGSKGVVCCLNIDGFLWLKCANNVNMPFKGLFYTLNWCLIDHINRLKIMTMTYSLRFKLFSTLLVATSGVVLCMYLVMQWSFNQGFLSHVNNQENHKYEAFAKVMAQEWQNAGDWKQVGSDRHYC
jgi:hypothetical protein